MHRNSQQIMSQSQKDEKPVEKQADKENQESTSQYQIRPSIGKSFPIAGIREIINEVLFQILDGKLMGVFWRISRALKLGFH